MRNRMDNRRSLLTGLLMAGICLSLFSCHKQDKCNAGKGGNLTIHLEAQHHEVPIYNRDVYRDSAFLKYGASDFPGTDPALYDLVVAGNPGDKFIEITSMKCGQYFIFMTGFDTSASWNTRVTGGYAINITEDAGVKTLIVPVSEK